MNVDRLYQIIIAPVLTEKSTRASETGNSVVFRVARDATKPEIREAVEKLFNVKVRGVRTVNVKGKRKYFGRIPGRRSDWKKAYVQLAEGQQIDLLTSE